MCAVVLCPQLAGHAVPTPNCSTKPEERETPCRGLDRWRYGSVRLRTPNSRNVGAVHAQRLLNHQTPLCFHVGWWKRLMNDDVPTRMEMPPCRSVRNGIGRPCAAARRCSCLVLPHYRLFFFGVKRFHRDHGSRTSGTSLLTSLPATDRSPVECMVNHRIHPHACTCPLPVAKVASNLTFTSPSSPSYPWQLRHFLRVLCVPSSDGPLRSVLFSVTQLSWPIHKDSEGS